MKKTNRQKHKIGGKSVTILGVRVDSTNTPEVLSEVSFAIEKRGTISIVTPNPEIVLEAQKDSELRRALNVSDISVPDGIGLIKAERVVRERMGFLKALWTFYGLNNGKGSLKLVKGRELFLELIRKADEKEWKVVLLGDRHSSAQNAKKELTRKFKKIKLYAIEGPNLTKNIEPVTREDIEVEKDIVLSIQKIRPHIVFIGFGAPRQEKWMAKWSFKLSSNVRMVVGGTFDYISGKLPEPPLWWPTSLEWLWRLLTKKGHLKRVWNAVVVFPYRVLVPRS